MARRYIHARLLRNGRKVHFLLICKPDKVMDCGSTCDWTVTSGDVMHISGLFHVITRNVVMC